MYCQAKRKIKSTNFPNDILKPKRRRWIK